MHGLIKKAFYEKGSAYGTFLLHYRHWKRQHKQKKKRLKKICLTEARTKFMEKRKTVHQENEKERE